MATTAQVRSAPIHLWIVGILATLWSAFGCYDYWMTESGNAAYLANMPPDMLAYMHSLPRWNTAMWALGVWGGLLGSVLLLVRSRFAVWAYALSFIGAVVGIGYQMFMTKQPAGMNTGAMEIMRWVIIAICAFLLWYSWNAEKKGVLR